MLCIIVQVYYVCCVMSLMSHTPCTVLYTIYGNCIVSGQTDKCTRTRKHTHAPSCVNGDPTLARESNANMVMSQLGSRWDFGCPHHHL